MFYRDKIFVYVEHPIGGQDILTKEYNNTLWIILTIVVQKNKLFKLEVLSKWLKGSGLESMFFSGN